MEPHETPPRRRRRGVLATAVSGLAIAMALPVSGALAGGGGPADGPASEGSRSPGAVQIQRQRPEDGQQRDRDCPEEHRGDQSGSGQQTIPIDPSQEL